MDQMHVKDTSRTLSPTAAEDSFFSRAHESFHRINHILGHIASLNNFKKMELISSIISNQMV